MHQSFAITLDEHHTERGLYRETAEGLHKGPGPPGHHNGEGLHKEDFIRARDFTRRDFIKGGRIHGADMGLHKGLRDFIRA